MRPKPLRLLPWFTAVILLIAGGLAFSWLNDRFDGARVSKASGLAEWVGASKPSQTAKQSLKTIIHESQKSVVQIIVMTGNEERIGSGFLYNDQGDVITNAHVVAGAKTVTVKTSEAKNYDGTVIGIGDSMDVAVVRVPQLAGEPPLKIDTAGTADIGDEVIAIGSPLGLQNSVSTGMISGTNRAFRLDPYTYKNMYQITAPITHGNSGGPLLLKKNGRAIAINSAGTDDGKIGFSLPLADCIGQIKAWSAHPQAVDGINGTAAGADGSLLANAKYVVNYFYESLTAHDYVTAYALLGSDWQEKTPYQTFRNGYMKTLDIRVQAIKSAPAEDGRASVTATVIAEEQANKGRVVKTKYQAVYTVGYENDQLKLLSGRQEKAKK